MNLAAIEIKAFLPAGDFERSKRFYAALGFEIPWSSEDLAYVRHGGTSFLLQAFDEPGFARNYQMHLLVENVDDFHHAAEPAPPQLGAAAAPDATFRRYEVNLLLDQRVRQVTGDLPQLVGRARR